MKTETSQPRIDRLRVNDVMHRGVFMCEQETRLSEVAATMAREHVHCVVVESESGEGGPLWGLCPTWTSQRRPQSASWTIRAPAGQQRLRS